MFVHLPEVESHAEQLLAAGRFNDALANVMVGAHNNYRLPEHHLKNLYYPGLDRCMRGLAAAVPDFAGPTSPTGRNSLVVATELYQVGGHTRVVNDILREAEAPVLVLTDVLGTLRKTPEHLSWILDSHPEVPVVVLSQATLWARARALAQLTQRLAPSSIVYLQHHQDPVAIVGTLGHRGSRKALVHHCDVSPSLGNTLPELVHLDFTDEQAAVCARALQHEAPVLPLYVADAPVKTFAPVQGRSFSVATAGTQIKYRREGDFALQGIARAVLQAIDGRFFHIGPLPADWADEVRAHLASQGLDGQRFVTLGPVASVWQTLAGLDAHVYLGSAPVAGGRGAIEAQGCGYPVVYHRVADRDSLLAVDSIYASPELAWGTLDELTTLLQGLPPRLPAAAARARRLYEDRFSRQRFRQVLADHTGVVLRT